MRNTVVNTLVARPLKKLKPSSRSIVACDIRLVNGSVKFGDSSLVRSGTSLNSPRVSDRVKNRDKLHICLSWPLATADQI